METLIRIQNKPVLILGDQSSGKTVAAIKYILSKVLANPVPRNSGSVTIFSADMDADVILRAIADVTGFSTVEQALTMFRRKGYPVALVYVNDKDHTGLMRCLKTSSQNPGVNHVLIDMISMFKSGDSAGKELIDKIMKSSDAMTGSLVVTALCVNKDNPTQPMVARDFGLSLNDVEIVQLR